MVKKFLTPIVSAALFISSILPVQAATWGNNSFTSNLQNQVSSYTTETVNAQESNDVSETKLAAPIIKSSSYKHHNVPYVPEIFVPFRPSLHITWEPVEGAEEYEVKITKADGTVVTKKVTTSGSLSYEDCPNGIVNGKKVEATAMVRALADGKEGEWSEAVNITCDDSHASEISETPETPDTPEIPETPDTPEVSETPEIVTDLETPVITEYKYTHSNRYIKSYKDILSIVWDEVDGAEKYEIEITKADGTSKVYKTSNTYLFIRKTDGDTFIDGCPKVKINGKWKAATVRVRATAEGKISEWSKTKNITCEAIHAY